MTERYDNQYIFSVPNSLFDFERLQEIALRNLNDVQEGLAFHQRRTETEPYLLELRERYPFLSPLYNISTAPAGYVVPIHFESNRNCAINVPVSYMEDSFTSFYEPLEPINSEFIPFKVYHEVKTKVKKVFSYTMTHPVLINNTLPHDVVGGPLKDRTILSWSISPKFRFEEIKEILKDAIRQ